MSDPESIVRLRHMLDAARKATSFMEGRSRADLDQNEMLALSLTRLLEILGEASRNVSESIREKHPEIAWQEIAATRNRLIHGYFDVDLDILWQIVQDDLPPLIASLKAIINELGTDDI